MVRPSGIQRQFNQYVDIVSFTEYPQNELTQFFDQCLKTTFRIWLSDIRFHAAKKMMQEYPKYNNDIISVECGFTSRTQLYRLFKTKEGCTPTVWRAKNVEITK